MGVVGHTSWPVGGCPARPGEPAPHYNVQAEALQHGHARSGIELSQVCAKLVDGLLLRPADKVAQAVEVRDNVSRQHQQVIPRLGLVVQGVHPLVQAYVQGILQHGDVCGSQVLARDPSCVHEG